MPASSAYFQIVQARRHVGREEQRLDTARGVSLNENLTTQHFVQLLRTLAQTFLKI